MYRKRPIQTSRRLVRSHNQGQVQVVMYQVTVIFGSQGVLRIPAYFFSIIVHRIVVTIQLEAKKMTPKTQFPGIHAPRNLCNSNNLGFLSSQLRDQKCVLTNAIPRQIIDTLIINKLFVLVLLMIVVIIIVVIIIKAAHEQEPQSPPVGFVPQRAIFRTKFRAKTQRGHVHQIKRLQYDI